MIPVPKPEDYDVSRVHGFLPTEPPLDRLPDPYFAPWEYLLQNLQGLILSQRLREVVDRLPVLSTAGLLDEAQWRRAYSVLGFVTHAYIWGGDKPAERVPPPISIPFLATCRHLELPPVATYAGLVLWNWKPIFGSEEVDSLANLDTIATFTGSLDEKWFYLISIAIEARGGPIIPLMLRAMEAAQYDDRATVTKSLEAFAERLDDLAAILVRMYDHCDPHVFYHRIRPFLAGSKNMSQAGLPNGVIFDDGGPINKQRYVQFSGGSNAQSSIIQFFDLVLGVQHHPTGHRPAAAAAAAAHDNTKPARTAKPATPPSSSSPPSPSSNFIHEMRRYMPGQHARFLRHVAETSTLRAYAQRHAADPALRLAFDACLAMLSRFRDAHIRIVSRYIIIKSREATPQQQNTEEAAGTSARKRDIASRPTSATAAAAVRRQDDALKGTGGTSLIPFLRQARDETGSPAIAAWTRRLLVRDRRLRGDDDNDDDDDRDDEGNREMKQPTSAVVPSREPPAVPGLAGVWRDGESLGGLCQI